MVKRDVIHENTALLHHLLNLAQAQRVGHHTSTRTSASPQKGSATSIASAPKPGIVPFTKVLAKQLALQGIRVNAIASGPHWTTLQPSGGKLPDKLPQFGADTPLACPCQPVEIAPLFVVLASSENSYATDAV